MKRILRLSLIVLFVTFSCALHAELSDQVVTGFSKGDISSIKHCFNENVELVIHRNDNIYSREQSIVILNNFLKQSEPTRCSLVHQGNRDNAQFVICNLETRKGTYRVYFLIKNNLIYQLRIENSNE